MKKEYSACAEPNLKTFRPYPAGMHGNCCIWSARKNHGGFLTPPGTIGQFHWILYSFFWWQEAKKLPAFRKELDAISRGLAPLLRRHIRSQQWKLFFSRGHIFRRRRDRIRWLKKVLSILDGRKL